MCEGLVCLQAHYAECTEYPVKCDRCSESVKKSSMEEHKEYHCPFVECFCGEQVWEIPRDWSTLSVAIVVGLSLGQPH